MTATKSARMETADEGMEKVAGFPERETPPASTVHLSKRKPSEATADTVMDVPGKKDYVTGIYDIPESAGTIKVKITDLLSESLETEVR